VGEKTADDADGLVKGVAAGVQIAGYRLAEEIGRGGMAVVFRARDERLGRQVALKILAPALAADEAFRQRFIRESRAAAAVDDPHIVPVFEAGESGGVLFIAMRYVPGGDARSLVRREGPLPPARAAAIISPVASALDAAHAAGLLHRDVKPGNMLMDTAPGRPDHVYLSDFGLSKAATSVSAGLTGTGQFLGTLDYVSPEQIAGKPADGRADEYALACSAFELLTGAPPFRRDEATALMYAQLSEPPPKLTAWRPDLPRAADNVLARALAKEPAGRYPSCREFADALRGALGLRSYDPAAGAPPTEHPATQAAAVPPGLADLPTAAADSPQAPRGNSTTSPGGDVGQAKRARRRRVGLAAAAAAVVLAGAVAVPLILSGGGPVPEFSPIAVKSALTPVTGDVYVVYQGGSQASATLSGTVKNVTSGEVARVAAQQFPFRRPPVLVGGSAILRPARGAARYTFRVTPALATRYLIEVFANSTATSPVATSPDRTVYVTLSATYGNGQACGRPLCHESFPIRVFAPAATLRTEIAKHWYAYFAINLAPVKEPGRPSVLLLGAGDAHVSAAQRVSATEFKLTITYSFTIGNDAYNWNWSACRKDSETTDGMGLPGHHGCGDRSVSATASYLG
jgi:serine/threonine protein kinase